jgi:DNA mismatch endonuclease, patch repair protein
MMSGIRSKNTRAEVQIRKGLFARGFRYRIHVRTLPGNPDIVLRRHNAAMFVNGCFWHRHACALSKIPSTRSDWWRKKLEGNRRRDARNIAALLSDKWRVLVIWECAFRKTGTPRTVGIDAVVELAARWLRGNSRHARISSIGLEDVT